MARSVPGVARTLVGWPTTSETLHVHRRGLDLPAAPEITWRATTSGGPGGQHANRTLSRVEVQFDVGASSTLGPAAAGPPARAGVGPVVRASARRSRGRRRAIASSRFERLAAKLDAGLRVEPARRATRPTKGSQVRRVEAKRRRSRDQDGDAAARARRRLNAVSRVDPRLQPVNAEAGAERGRRGRRSSWASSSASSSARGPRRAVRAA